MNLIEAFEQKLVNGFEDKTPDKIIETIVSKIFFYGEDVYKVYKYEKFFFGDFTDKNFRENFYREDFYWNNVTAPRIYLSLKPVKSIGGKYKIVDSEPEDFFIEMKKFDECLEKSMDFPANRARPSPHRNRFRRACAVHPEAARCLRFR